MSERDILSSGFHFVCLLNRKHTHSLINKKFQRHTIYENESLSFYLIFKIIRYNIGNHNRDSIFE